MGLSIYNNVEAQNAHRQIGATNWNLSKSMERLSSGLRINRAADDAAGLAVSEEMRADIRGMDIAKRNAMDGVSLVQTADGAMGSVGDMLGRLRDLAVQATNGTLSTSQRKNLDVEFQQVLKEIDAAGTTVEFNGIKILGGSIATAASAMTLQVGHNGGNDSVIAFTVGTVSSAALTLHNSGITTQSAAQNAIASIDTAISANTTNRAKLGAIQNRLEQTVSRIGVMSENMQAAESRVRDADMAKEMIMLTRNQILSQSGMAMLSQANQAPQSVLSLIR